MKIFYAMLLLLIFAVPAYAKDKNSSIEDAVRDEIREELGYDDNNKGKGHGRPDNPGEHGRDNAAEKQRENPGKGSKGGDSWEDRVSDVFDDDDKDKDKDKDKKKGKDKKKH